MHINVLGDEQKEENKWVGETFEKGSFCDNDEGLLSYK